MNKQHGRKWAVVAAVVAGLMAISAAAMSLGSSNATASTPEFHPVTLENGWTGAPFATRVPAVFKDSTGIVHFQGAAAQSGTFNATMFVLPLRYRPHVKVFVATDLCNANPGRIVVLTDGTVQVEPGSQLSSANAQAQCFTSLEGVSYHT